ncbi:MAG: MDR family NADPH-dependent oxidoreductase [Verrucomicrobiales bacterium]
MRGKHVSFAVYGVPEQVAACEEFDIEAAPGPGQVLVKMLASPINPADINFIEGVYGIKPALPATGGLEGCGEVLAVGDNVVDIRSGAMVMRLRGYGSWASLQMVPADDLLVLPPGLDPLQAAMLKVNPMTAWLLITGGGKPSSGTWVAQNAANSGVGQCVIQLAKVLGLHTLNLVRRPEAIPALLDLGADNVLLDEPGWVENAPARPPLALNAVGGDSATRLMDVLSEKGRLVTYGAMSKQGVKVPNKFLLFKGIELHGFWLTRWLRETPADEIAAAYQQLAQWMVEGKLKMAVEAAYTLDQAREAIARAREEKRGGKILFVGE